MSALTDRLKKILVVAIENVIKDNFKDEGFMGEKWEARKSKDRSDRRNPDKPRKLLTKTRTLLRSINVKETSQGIQVSSNVPYAKIHNEGGTINHPGGTPYIFSGKVSQARGNRARLRNFGKDRAIWLKKDGDYPEGTKFTKPHKIPIPARPFIKNSPKLTALLKEELKKEAKRFITEQFNKKTRR